MHESNSTLAKGSGCLTPTTRRSPLPCRRRTEKDNKCAFEIADRRSEYLPASGAKILPHFSAGWLYDIPLDKETIVAPTADAPEAALRLGSALSGRNGVGLRGTVDCSGRDQIALSAEVEAELREDRSDMSALLRAEWHF